MRHVLAVLCHNQPGVLVRILNVFSRRGLNIERLTVEVTPIPQYSRITTEVGCDKATMNQALKHLVKIVDVVAVQLLQSGDDLAGEKALLKVEARQNYEEVLQLSKLFSADLLDRQDDTLTLEIDGDKSKIHAFADAVLPYGLVEVPYSRSCALRA